MKRKTESGKAGEPVSGIKISRASRRLDGGAVRKPTNQNRTKRMKTYERENDGHPFTVGKNYFLRTVTHYYTGRLEAVHGQELVLAEAAWIADTGRFSEMLATGKFNEVELYPKGSRVIVGRGSLIDAVEIASLPTETK